MTAGTPFAPSLLQREEALAAAADGLLRRQVAAMMGVSQQAFNKYLLRNQDFGAALREAELVGAECYLDRVREYIDGLGDPNQPVDVLLARVRLDNMFRWLAVRFPRQYGAKLSLDVTHTVDIRGAIDRARQRVMAQGAVLPGEYHRLPTDSPSVVKNNPPDD